ncbi:MAG: protein phosphatase 2C domain-containing protein [bacterium]
MTLENQSLLETVVLCETGPVREHNEDRVAIVDTSVLGTVDRGTVLVVADGMGGLDAGEVASSIVAEELPHLFLNSKISNCVESLIQAVADVNKNVYEAAALLPSRRGMGTTVVASVVVNECFITVNVGDSRAYLLRNGELRQVSKDHSLKRNYFGMFGSKYRDNLSHVLTQAIGPQPSVTPHVNVTKVQKDDILLLCSDGLTSVLSDEEIKNVLVTAPFKQSAEKLFDLVLQRKGDDNVSVIVSKVMETRPSGCGVDRL